MSFHGSPSSIKKKENSFFKKSVMGSEKHKSQFLQPLKEFDKVQQSQYQGDQSNTSRDLDSNCQTQTFDFLLDPKKECGLQEIQAGDISSALSQESDINLDVTERENHIPQSKDDNDSSNNNISLKATNYTEKDRSSMNYSKVQTIQSLIDSSFKYTDLKGLKKDK